MNTKIMKLAVVLCAPLLMFGSPQPAQSAERAPYQEGLHYFVIDQAPVNRGDTMELVEAFSYLCTHCNTFEPYLDSWKKRKPENVNFRRVPVVFGRGSWELYARAYVTAEIMNLPEETHMAMMDKLWKEKNIMRTMEEIAEFYTQFGVDKDKFLSTSKSFAVDGKIRKDQILLQGYKIQATPSLVLNGKYRISGNEAVANYDVMLDVVDYLIDLDTREMQQ